MSNQAPKISVKINKLVGRLGGGGALICQN